GAPLHLLRSRYRSVSRVAAFQVRLRLACECSWKLLQLLSYRDYVHCIGRRNQPGVLRSVVRDKEERTTHRAGSPCSEDASGDSESAKARACALHYVAASHLRRRTPRTEGFVGTCRG